MSLNPKKLAALPGRTITAVAIEQWGGYEPTGLTLTLDDGSELIVSAITVGYDQYSRSECLRVKHQPPGAPK